jgi:hypothetical protein
MSVATNPFAGDPEPEITLEVVARAIVMLMGGIGYSRQFEMGELGSLIVQANRSAQHQRADFIELAKRLDELVEKGILSYQSPTRYQLKRDYQAKLAQEGITLSDE